MRITEPSSIRINRSFLKKASVSRELYTCGDGWVLGNGGAPMPTAKEYRQHAEECLELAKQAEEFYVKDALIELAAEFNKQAEKLK
jgi:hypothetical protein